MSELPDCPGCTDPQSEGTHSIGTKQHPTLFHETCMGWTDEELIDYCIKFGPSLGSDTAFVRAEIRRRMKKP